MKNKFAFIQPYIDDGNLTPPIGTLIMASIIEDLGWDVSIFDERLEISALNSLIDSRPDIIGISAVTPSLKRGLELSAKIKDALPDTTIIFGGPHPTLMPKEVLDYDSVDFVVVGEGEHAIRDICDWYRSGRRSSDLGKIPNLCYKSNGTFVSNEPSPFLSSEELDKLPIPAFHLLDIERVFKKVRHGIFQRGKRVLPVMSSRGCPNLCTYCCRVMGFKIRYRGVASILNEIESLISKYNVDEIWFEDDNFTVNRKRANEILDSLVDRNLGISIKFANGLRADGVDYEIMGKMKKAGCYSISFGIESGSARVLKMMKKNLSLKKAEENVKFAKSMGFLVGSNCILGYPGETVEDINESLDYFMNLNLDSMAVVNLIPFPGTEVRRICEEKNYLTEEAKDWNNYTFNIKEPNILIETEFLNSADLKRLISTAYRRMYLNPGRIFRILQHMGPADILEGAKVMAKKVLDGFKY